MFVIKKWSFRLKLPVYLGLSLFFFFSFLHAKGQSFLTNLEIQTKYHHGILFPHHKSIRYSVSDNISGIEINLMKQTRGDKPHQVLYRYPRIGVGYFYSQLQDNSVWGDVHGIFPFMNFPVFLPRHSFSLNYQLSFGLSYLTKHFDIQENVRNIAIGSHGNIYFNLCMDARWNIMKNLELSGTAGVIHFSNGNFKKPNLGLNLITFAPGLIYKFNPTVQERKKFQPDSLLNKKIMFNIGWSAGVRTYNLYHNNFMSASSFYFDAGKMISYKRRIGVGLDVFYNQSLEYKLTTFEGYTEVNHSDLMQYGIHGYQDLVYDRLVMTLQIGYYVYASYIEKPIYSRFGLRYYVLKNWYANLSLKTHFAVADFIEWGIGYSIFKR